MDKENDSAVRCEQHQRCGKRAGIILYTLGMSALLSGFSKGSHLRDASNALLLSGMENRGEKHCYYCQVIKILVSIISKQI